MKFWSKPNQTYKHLDNPALETNELLAGDISRKIPQIQLALSHTEDLRLQTFLSSGQSCTLMYLEPLIKQETVQSHIISPMLETDSSEIEKIVTSLEVKKSSRLADCVTALLEGYCIILREVDPAAFIISAAQWQGRSIEEPKDEQVIKGAHEGFIESLSTNLNLLRKQIKSPLLKVKYFTIGRISNTKVAMIYMDSIADPQIIEECEKRLEAIELDYLYSAATIDEMLEEHPMSPFPQTMQTGRPDRAASYMMEGKVALMVEGSPITLVLPITFFTFYQSADDYNHRWIIGSFFRFIRLISFILAISLPAIYIAIVSYHSEVLPIGILYSIKVSLTYVPFPPLMEAITMQIILELLKEAAIRLPSPISQTIGIVGGLVIGTAVVEANLVSNTMIVVIALTAIASFAAPLNEFGTSLRILGFPTMLAAAVLGFFGIIIILMIIFMHLCKMESMGVPYFEPFGPYYGRGGMNDVFLRMPVWKNAQKRQ